MFSRLRAVQKFKAHAFSLLHVAQASVFPFGWEGIVFQINPT